MSGPGSASGWRKVRSEVHVRHLKGEPHGRRFMACVRIGSGQGRRSNLECVWSSTPRKALKLALKQSSETIGRRQGAFNYRGLGRDVR